jgi:D-cysteine desulfhydrase family pyridoxal phosphate-dependent enzyme
MTMPAPRLPLGEYPTPLEPLPRLSRQVGRPIYVKRDDLIGPGMGGNKTRKLEYLLGEAQAQRARKVVTFGGLQSNHARLTAAAANRLGMQTHLFYFERRPAQMSGNLLLNQLLGAQMHFIPLGGGGNGMSLETTIRLVRWVARLVVGRHYFIPVGGHNATGGLGYAEAAVELDRQARRMDIPEACVVLAAGSGGTLAGLMAGMALANSSLGLLGIDVGKLWKGFPASIAHLAGEICTRLGQPRSFAPAQTPLLEAVYVGDGYGRPSAAGCAALRRAARLEGLLLDPVYTAKAFAGLLDLAERGRLGSITLRPGQPLIFLHTGGVPALFAFEEEQLLS